MGKRKECALLHEFKRINAKKWLQLKFDFPILFYHLFTIRLCTFVFLTILGNSDSQNALLTFTIFIISEAEN